MSRTSLASLVVAAFLVGLVALPRTRWVVPHQLELLSGAWELEPDDLSQTLPDVEPKVVPLPVHLAPTAKALTIADPATDEERLYELIQRPSVDERHAEPWDRFREMETVCRRLDSAPAWAQLLRTALLLATLSGGTPGFEQRRQDLQSLLLTACRQGELKDPDNAFFPLMRAALLRARTDAAGAEQAFLAASRKGRYEAYEWTETTWGRRALEKRYPRSGWTYAWLAAGVLLPQEAVIRDLARHYSKGGSPALRGAACRVGGLLLTTGTSPLDPVVGMLIVAYALQPEGNVTRLDRLSPEAARARAAELAAATGDSRMIELARDYGNAYTLFKGGRLFPTGEPAQLHSISPLAGACVLAAFAALALFLLVRPLRARLPARLSESGAALAWLLVLPLASAGVPGRSPLPPSLAILALIGVLAVSPGTRRLVPVLNAVAALAVVIALPDSVGAWTIAALVFAFEVRARRFPESWGAAATLTVLAALTTGAVAALGGLGGSALLGVGYGAAAWGVFALILPVVPRVHRDHSAGAALVALGALYVGSVLVAVQADAGARAVERAWLSEAARIRQECRLSPP